MTDGLRQALLGRTSPIRAWGPPAWERGVYEESESLACRMWIYWQGVKEKHNIHARGLDFLVKDDLAICEFNMFHFFKFSARF